MYIKNGFPETLFNFNIEWLKRYFTNRLMDILGVGNYFLKQISVFSEYVLGLAVSYRPH